MSRARRRVLQGLVVTLPAAWTRPVVESLILPAHAQTSPGECTAEAGCYEGTNLVVEFNFLWPGGGGVFTVEVFDDTACEGEEPRLETAIALARSAEEAFDLLSCNELEDVFEVETVPAVAGDCSLFTCD